MAAGNPLLPPTSFRTRARGMLTRPRRRSTPLSSVARRGTFPALSNRCAFPARVWRALLAMALWVAHVVGGLELSRREAEQIPDVNLVCRERISDTIVYRFFLRFQTRWHPGKYVWVTAIAGPRNRPFMPCGHNLLPFSGSIQNTTSSPKKNPGMPCSLKRTT